MKKEDENLGAHVGNLLYHLEVLKKAQSLRKMKLFRVRKKLTDKEKIEIYINFSKKVDERLERLQYHLENIFHNHLSEDAKNHAENIRNSEMEALK